MKASVTFWSFSIASIWVISRPWLLRVKGPMAAAATLLEAMVDPMASVEYLRHAWTSGRSPKAVTPAWMSALVRSQS